MLAALTPSSTLNTSVSSIGTMPVGQSLSLSFPISNNNTTNSRMTTSSASIHSNGSSFGWRKRERKIEENWRLQNRNI